MLDQTSKTRGKGEDYATNKDSEKPRAWISNMEHQPPDKLKFLLLDYNIKTFVYEMLVYRIGIV